MYRIFPDLGGERIWVSREYALDCLNSLRIESIHVQTICAFAPVAQGASSKAFAIQLEASALSTVTWNVVASFGRWGNLGRSQTVTIPTAATSPSLMTAISTNTTARPTAP